MDRREAVEQLTKKIWEILKDTTFDIAKTTIQSIEAELMRKGELLLMKSKVKELP